MTQKMSMIFENCPFLIGVLECADESARIDTNGPILWRLIRRACRCSLNKTKKAPTWHDKVKRYLVSEENVL